MQNAITFEMSMSRKEYSRTVYNIMDFMRDMGGLFTTLGLIFGTLVGILQYRGMYMLITGFMLQPSKRKNNYDRDTKDKEKEPKMVKQMRLDQMKKKKEINWHCCRVSLFNMQMRCPKKCKGKRLKCLRRSYNEHILMSHYR